MKYDNLPIYKAAYDLAIEIFNASVTMKRDFRYTLGEEIKKEATALIISIFRANSNQNKEPHIIIAREHIETIRLMLRLLHDLRQLPLRRLAKTNLTIDDIAKQLTLWHKATKNRQTKPNSVEPDNEPQQNDEILTMEYAI